MRARSWCCCWSRVLPLLDRIPPFCDRAGRRRRRAGRRRARRRPWLARGLRSSGRSCSPACWSTTRSPSSSGCSCWRSRSVHHSRSHHRHRRPQDGQDFYTLVLGATLGMCLMASANHLLMVFLGVEMASVPSYVLAGMLKGRRRSSEAALKYAVYGAGAAGVMLYGISLLAGVLGSAHLPTMAQRLVEFDIAGASSPSGELGGDGAGPRRPDDGGRPGVQALGRAVPLLVPGRVRRRRGRSRRVPVGRLEGRRAGAAGPRRASASARPADAELPPTARDRRAVASSTPSRSSSRRRRSSSPRRAAEPAAADSADRGRRLLARSARSSSLLLAVIAVVTCTFGNLAAYGQTNIKRLLAYSTIAHAGFMMMPVAAAVQLAGTNAAGAREADRRAAVLRRRLRVHEPRRLRHRRVPAQRDRQRRDRRLRRPDPPRPVTSVAFTAILFSLIGMPPLAGFSASSRSSTRWSPPAARG